MWCIIQELAESSVTCEHSEGSLETSGLNVKGNYFFYLRSFKSHMAKHAGETSFICECCGLSFSREFSLNVHKATHHKDCLYLCSKCPKSFPTEISLARHKEQEHVLIYDCDSCDLRFPRRQNLMRHKKMKHCVNSPTLRCGDCDMSFRDSQDLHTHMECVHQNKKEYVCKACGKAFGDKSYLLKHLKSCLDEEEIDPLSAVTVVQEEPQTTMTSEISAVGRDGDEGKCDVPTAGGNEEEESTESISPMKHEITESNDTESQFEHFVTEDPEDPFNYAATKILIDGIQKRYSMMAAIPKRPTVYREMAEELSAHGYNIPVHEIRKKWCNIVSYFWSLRNRPDSKDWEFFEQLSSFLEVDSQASVTSSDEFDHNSTTALIESVRKRYDSLMHTVSRNRTIVYVDICEEVNSYGYNFDVQKMRRKWNNLLAQYKRVKKMTHATEVWEFFQQMNDFLDPGTSGPIIIEATSKKVPRVPLSPPASPGSPIYTEVETPSSSKKFVKVAPIKSEVAALQSSKRDSRNLPPSSQPKRVLSPSRPAPAHSKKSVSTPVPKAEYLPHPLVIPNSSNSITGNPPGRPEKDTSSHMNGVSKRLALLEEYIFSLKQKENEERIYRMNKERRSKIKLKLLAKMGRQLDVIAKTQSEILNKQDKLLQSLEREVVDK